MGSERAGQVLIRVHVAGGERVNAVAVGGCVDGVDAAGQAVLRHAGDLAELRFREGGVGQDRGQGGIGQEFVFPGFRFLHHLLRGAAERFFVFREQARDLPAGVRIEHIAQRVHGRDRADLQVPELHRVTADTGFHAELHAFPFAHGGAAARAEIAVAVIRGFPGQAGGFTAHGGVRADVLVADGQVEEAGLDDERDFRDADVEADAVLLQEAHDAAGRVQAESAAAGKHDGVNGLHRHQGA